MATKRVILAHDARLLREMFRRVIDKADHLEVVQEVLEYDELPGAIERFEPEWVILSLPLNENARGWVDTCLADYPGVRFILLSAAGGSIKLRWQASYEEDLTHMSLKDFIQLLEKDLQRT